MPSSLPQSVREAWGEEVATDLARFIEQTVREQGVPRDEYREVLSRLDVLENEIEGRFGEVDKRFDRLDERLNHMDERLDSMNARIDERFDAMNARMDERFDKMDGKLDQMNDRILSMTRWLIGLLVAFGTMVTVLLGIAQFTG